MTWLAVLSLFTHCNCKWFIVLLFVLFWVSCGIRWIRLEFWLCLDCGVLWFCMFVSWLDFNFGFVLLYGC